MYRLSSLSQLPDVGLSRCAITCGVFDGVHVGHQSILKQLHECATETDAFPVAVTFDPHPRAVLRPEAAPRLLFSIDHRLDFLEDEGVKAAVTLRFDRELCALSAAEFANQVLGPAGLEIAAICVGDSWRFGAKASGTVADLRRFFPAAKVVGVSETELTDAVVSSTRIRAAAQAGDLPQAEQLLGRTFSVRGTVVRGKGLGRTLLGCATANLHLTDYVSPPKGIYACEASLFPEDGRREHAERHAAAVYIGHAPTVSAGQPLTLEAHLFDFSEDIYDRTIEVKFLKRLRNDERFDSLETLRAQIQRDLLEARQVLHRAGVCSRPLTAELP